jgi:ribonuclease HI
MQSEPPNPSQSESSTVTIYTDGGCLGNPGPGGYGVILIAGDRRKELSCGYRLTTNNRMEIMGAIAGLEALKRPCRVTLYSDSEYLVNAIEQGWAVRWRAKGWRRGGNEPALNPDLWERLLRLCEVHEVRFKWLRGHAGHGENERCDELARDAARGPDLEIDEGYERRDAGSRELLR